MSHHSTLQNFIGPENTSDFCRRNLEKDLPNYDECLTNYFQEVISERELDRLSDMVLDELGAVYHSIAERFPTSVDNYKTYRSYYYHMVIKLLHGWLIDSDWLDSGHWMDSKNIIINKKLPNWQLMYDNLMNNKYDKFGAPSNDVERVRGEIAAQCEAFSNSDTGIYNLSVPTGSGKTLSVLRFALPHAIKHNMRHIIEVVPYTSIIEQNAADVRSAVQKKNSVDYVFEHHCNMDMALDKEGNATKLTLKRKAVTERWDAPIIFTTQVRLLDMLFGKNKGDMRRLNALHDSILIFDEIQTLPTRCIYMFNLAMNFLKDYCNCTIVLSTATQPGLDKLEYSIYNDGNMVTGLDSIFDTFKRVHVEYNPQVVKPEGLGSTVFHKAKYQSNALCILNTTTAARKIAKEVIESKKSNFDEEVRVIYLSTKLCPRHRKDIIKDIKESLLKKEKIACITTQLVEAGVDFSFCNVLRSLAALSSIAQAAGRCNRNGESDYGTVTIFDPSSLEKLTKLIEIKEGREIMQVMLPAIIQNNDLDNIFKPEYIDRFYNYRNNNFARHMRYTAEEVHNTIFSMLSTNKEFADGASFNVFNKQAFRTAAEYFEVIPDGTSPILVPYKEKGRKLIELAQELSPETCSIKRYKNFLKSCQEYSVNIWQYEKDALVKAGYINTDTLSGVDILTNPNAYSDMYGIDIAASNNFCCI